MAKLRRTITERLSDEYNRKNHIKEGVEYDPEHSEKMHPDIESKLRAKSHHLGGHPAFPGTGTGQHFEEKVASKRFKEVVERVKRYTGVRDITQQQVMGMMRILSDIMRKERSERSKLEKLAIKIVKQEFGITDQLQFDAKLVDPGQVSLGGAKMEPSKEEMEFKTPEHKEEVSAEIQKRRLLNSLMQGAAKKGHYMYHMVEDELSNVDATLSDLYGKLMSINDFTYWIMPDEAMTMMAGGDANKAGSEEIDLQTDPPTVKARAQIFPVLVHELIKGVMEVMSVDALPEDEKIAQYVTDKADFISAEFWDLRLGPGLWDRFRDAIDINDHDLRYYLYNEISKMPAKEFNQFINDLFSEKQSAKQKLVDIANQIRKEMKEDDYKEAINYRGDEDQDEDDEDYDIDISDLFK
jgi:hypothetical protein